MMMPMKRSWFLLRRRADSRAPITKSIFLNAVFHPAIAPSLNLVNGEVRLSVTRDIQQGGSFAVTGSRTSAAAPGRGLELALQRILMSSVLARWRQHADGRMSYARSSVALDDTSKVGRLRRHGEPRTGQFGEGRRQHREE